MLKVYSIKFMIVLVFTLHVVTCIYIEVFHPKDQCICAAPFSGVYRSAEHLPYRKFVK